MSQHGAALQNYNNELVKCLEDLHSQRTMLTQQIANEEEMKNKLQGEIHALSEKLANVNESLAKKLAARAEFDKTIADTETAYTKILESSQLLLSVLKRDAAALQEPNQSPATKMKTTTLQ